VFSKATRAVSLLSKERRPKEAPKGDSSMNAFRDKRVALMILIMM
jgi:hypothetical protein